MSESDSKSDQLKKDTVFLSQNVILKYLYSPSLGTVQRKLCTTELLKTWRGGRSILTTSAIS